MDKMKFMMFTWPENPEHFEVYASRLPKYTQESDGTYTFDGLEPFCRVISGSGVFYGKDAKDSFNALAVIMAMGKMGELSHPVWGTSNAYLTELTLNQESRPDYVAYSFVFREADELGTVPKLPDKDE